LPVVMKTGGPRRLHFTCGEGGSNKASEKWRWGDGWRRGKKREGQTGGETLLESTEHKKKKRIEREGGVIGETPGAN